MSLRHFVSMAALSLATACTVGRSLPQYATPNNPGGATVTVQFKNAKPARADIEGELIAVEDTALIVLRTPLELVRIPLTPLRRVRARIADFVMPLTTARIERLRRVSRYPQGLSLELSRQLLNAYGLPMINTVPQ